MLTFDEVKDTFEFFDDWKDRYEYIIDLGKKLPNIPVDLQTDEHLVRGCQSRVWLVMKLDSPNDRVEIQLDSDAFIVRGLITILLTLFQHRSPAEVVAVDTEGLFDELGLIAHLSPIRGNGLRSMVARIRAEASEFLANS